MRRRLLKAARRIFARHGFEAARIEDIAAEAGHSRGAFYANFKTKEDLFFAMLEQHANEKIAKLQSSLASCATAQDRLACIRDFYLAQATDREWMMLTLEFKLFALRHPNLRKRLAAAHRRIRSSLKLSFLNDLLPELFQPDSEQSELSCVVLEATRNGLVLEHAYDPHRISEGQVVSALGRIYDLFVDE